jgi:CheY-like chemotaxis protein
MEFILAKQGHDMLAATNGEQALEMIRSEKPDLVLLDIMMPRIDGYEVARIMRADEALRDIPIIMLSAKAQDHDIQKGIAVGVDEYITKPFAPDHLVHVVNEYLARRVDPGTLMDSESIAA